MDRFNDAGVDNVDFVCDTIEHYLQEGKGRFDLIYIDGKRWQRQYSPNMNSKLEILSGIRHPFRTGSGIQR